MNKFLIVVLGPTAVGKTEVSIQLAKHYKTEILSADSRQVFKELTIGTAKPDSQNLKSVKHWFINHIPITETFNAGIFEKEALKVLDSIYQRKDIAILTGGSGLYVQALLEGFDEIPFKDAEIRDSLNKIYVEGGLEPLQEKLKALDPEYFEIVDLHNPHRLIRAIEVCLVSGRKYSDLRKNEKKTRSFIAIKTGLEMERPMLYKEINQRVDKMIQSGLVEEVKQLKGYKHLSSLDTVGYKEIFGHLDGNTLEYAVELIKRNTRRYAKRQMTWFRKDKDIYWSPATDIESLIKYVDTQITSH